MKVRDLLTKIRLRLGDMQGARYSDYELLSAADSAMKMLWIALAECFSSIPRVTREIRLVSGVAPLPKNFYSLVSISDNARVDGFMIRGGGGSVTLTYNIIPPGLNFKDSDKACLDDDIACLDHDPLVPAHRLLASALGLETTEIAAAIAQGNTEAAASIAASSARRISQKREHSRIPDRRPFR